MIGKLGVALPWAVISLLTYLESLHASPYQTMWFEISLLIACVAIGLVIVKWQVEKMVQEHWVTPGNALLPEVVLHAEHAPRTSGQPDTAAPSIHPGSQ